MNYQTLKARYDGERISKAMLCVYVRKGIISTAQYQDITGEQYPAT